MKSLLLLFHRLRRSSSLPVGDGTFDVFGRLPFELIFLILVYLEPGSLSAAARSSRSLRCVVLSDEVWPFLADRWFPGLAGFIQLTAVNERNKCELFQRALSKISARIDGKFTSAVHHGMVLESDSFFQLSTNVAIQEGGVHSYDIIVQEMDVNPEQRFLRFMMYSNGRIAWWPEAFSLPYFAIVDDFRTRTRRAYLFPHHGGRNHGYRTAMGEKLLILCRDTTVYAWHLELDRLQSFELPETFKRCATQGETVLIVSRTADVFIWKYGQALQHIDMGTLPCYVKGPVGAGGLETFTNVTSPFATDGLYLQANQLLIDFIASPKDSDTFFVITLPRRSLQEIIVYEIHNGECIESHTFEVPMLRSRNISHVGYLRSEKIDCYGGYSLIHALMESSSANANAGINEMASCPCGRNFQELITVCFNVYTKSFTVLYHHLPRTLTTWTFHLWNNRLSLRNCNPHGESTVYENYITSLTPCSSEQVFYDSKATIPLYSTTPTSTPFIFRRRLVTSNLTEPCEEPATVDFALDIHQQFTPTSANDLQPRTLAHKLEGDDDYLLFFYDKKYTVWSFGDIIPSKPARKGQKRSLWGRTERDIR
ncbi:hypothetical protein F4775DRAFT_464339 [Biscogniauxia sp. FL1348]|nr:hypothetical protein F4775DRAFT_464339 [Biscogniauxia sp. FL1348]